jgi:small subunit ribosomal protein S8
MSMSDPVGDMLTRIRNAQRVGKAQVVCLFSKHNEAILRVLQAEGYVGNFEVREIRAGVRELVVTLRYHEGTPVIQMLERVSKPGRRVYSPIQTLPYVRNGLGVAILSTPKGVMSDATARQENLGGEVICRVF